MVYVFVWVRIILYTIGLILHTFGITAIVLNRRKTNQSIILVNISIATILTLCREVAETILSLLDPQGGYCNDYCRIGLSGTQFMVGTLLIVLMLLLNVDRFSSILSPLKYMVHMSLKRTKKLVYLCYILSMVMLLVAIFHLETYFPLTVIFITISVIFVVLSIITYTYIFLKIRLSRRRNIQRRSFRGERMRRSYMVPSIIVFDFIVVYGIPWIIIEFYVRDLREIKKYVLHHGLKILMAFGYILDPLIYVFLTKEYRKLVMEKCFSCEHLRRTSASTSTITISARSVDNQANEPKPCESYEINGISTDHQ